jgi:hypothetical protein
LLYLSSPLHNTITQFPSQSVLFCAIFS